MNNVTHGEQLLPECTTWKRVLVLTLSLFQTCLVAPAAVPVKFTPPQAEAADNPVPTGAGSEKKKFRERGTRRDSLMRRVLRGKASWYGPRFHGKKTANGDIFDQRKLTAAHKTLPLGTKAIITNLENGNSVEAEINDRGPYVPGRVIDVSYAAAKELGFVKTGIASVEVQPIVSESGRTG